MDKIKEMEEFAQLHDVPIMEPEGIHFMCEFIKENKVKNILEIGTAIGYSAICMAQVDPTIHITSIERDEERYHLAVSNVKALGLQDRIELILGDALESVVSEKYDLLFIDAAKAQYIKFFERYEVSLLENGYIISDNLGFHGLVENPDNIQSRSLRQLVRKIKKYIEYLEQRDDYETKFLKLGDGVAISKKK